MTEQIVTVEARMLSVDDVWSGERVISVANSAQRPHSVDVTLFDLATHKTRIESFPRSRWLQVTRGKVIE